MGEWGRCWSNQGRREVTTSEVVVDGEDGPRGGREPRLGTGEAALKFRCNGDRSRDG